MTPHTSTVTSSTTMSLPYPNCLTIDNRCVRRSQENYGTLTLLKHLCLTKLRRTQFLEFYTDGTTLDKGHWCSVSRYLVDTKYRHLQGNS